MHTPPALSILIPAHDEEALIGRCLGALLEQDGTAPALQVVVVPNGCRDGTAAAARALAPRFAARGWSLEVVEIPGGGKTGALNAGEAAARHGARAYLDADVTLDPGLTGQIARALDTAAPRYATGRLAVAPARTWVTRAYARAWTRLPFVTGGTVGAGFFALNAAGRARWGAWPAIISDDTFARLQFAPGERIEVPARYHWPMVEGLGNLVRVRRRQDAGVAELRRLHPALDRNAGKAPLTPGALLRLAAAAPLGLAVYLAVHLAVRLRPAGPDWTRGR
ncbi:MAG TPA: glycosyltransferase [Paracoccaceae bacterium]|nr:glycosyltransferase [Paracoccaceae bacterium]HMO70032.1 glycosyltransferase [Paracoccaceae bacterium]